MMTPYLPVPGTWAWDGEDAPTEWWRRGSVFARHMAAEGFEQIGDERSFWSTALDGVNLVEKWLQRGQRIHRIWRFGGETLARHLGTLPAVDRRLIVHSHGLQPALYAIAEHKLVVPRLISVGSPVRGDMMAIADRARPLIGGWLHVASDASDRWQWLGELLDGQLGIVREHPLADQNLLIREAGHSGLLRDQLLIDYIVPSLAAFLRGVA